MGRPAHRGRMYRSVDAPGSAARVSLARCLFGRRDPHSGCAPARFSGRVGVRQNVSVAPTGVPSHRSGRGVVEIRDLVKVYPGEHEIRAVDGLTLEVKDGEIFGLLGPNGAGKTTVVGACTTRVRPTSGEVRVRGTDVTDDPARVKRSIGVVNQANTLDVYCTVFENLYFHCRYFGMGGRESRERAEGLLATFRLSERSGANPGELSGGMARRLQVARAVAHRPAVLFLDEPTAGLDPQGRLALWETLQEMRREEGVSVLMTTHHMEEADRLCDRVAIIDHGRILVCDSPTSLKGSLGATTVAELRLEGGSEKLAEKVAKVAGVSSVDPIDTGLRVYARRSEGLLPKIVAVAHGHGLRDISVKEPTLETVFVDLTGRDLRD